MTNARKGSSSCEENNNLTPQQVAVIAGILIDALKVQAVLIDSNGRVEIVLEGHLKEKRKLMGMLEQMDNLDVYEVINAFLNR